MTLTENAKVIEAEELKEMIEEELTNPTIERLMFIETKEKGDIPGKVFPCYLVAWGQEENAEVKSDPGLRFRVDILQCVGGEFSIVQVIVMANELGVNKRIWDKPPTKGRREYIPWATVAEGLQ